MVNHLPWLLPSCCAIGAFIGWYGEETALKWTPHIKYRPSRRARWATTLLSIVLFLALALRFGFTETLPGYLFLAASGTILSRIDLETKLLPNRIVWPTLWMGAGLLVLASGTAHSWPNLARAALGALILFSLYLILALISPAGLGMGDVKLAAVLGMYSAYISWGTLFVTGFLGFLLGAMVALVVAASGRGQRTTTFPFGPSMFGGAIISILGSATIVPFLFPFLPALH